MKITASDFSILYRPTPCDFRVYLDGKGVKPTPPGPFDQVLARLGKEHEKRCLAGLPTCVDLGEGSQQQRAVRTQQEMAKGTPAIYHGFFIAKEVVDGTECEVVGEPDFLIADRHGYVVRDAKMSRRITEKDHPEIVLQMSLYGWLFERMAGRRPAGLQVHGGTGEITELPYDAGIAAMDAIRRIVSLRLAKSESYCPVGWTKCGACGYHERCWTQAEARHDVAVISGVDQGLASALQQQGIGSYEKLLAAFDEGSLAGLSRPWGQGSQRVGKKAGSILRAAKAVTTGKEIVLGSPAIPAHDNYVMFDLEGLPPQLDDMGKIYLWGMQVFGKRPGPYMAATAGFGDGGDRQGWDDFLAKAETIFAEYGDIPFVHWAPYEKTHLGEYVERFGDRKGIAARVKRNLLDLLPITRESVALPLPSYSLKVVEVHVGFKRTQDEYGGNWSMAKYIEATELQDEAERAAVMDQILTYNREDLEATWAVFKWLRAKIR